MAGASGDAGGEAGPGGLYRLEDGVLVIEWSPEVDFSLNSSAGGDNSSAAGAANGINASLESFPDENASLSLAASCGHLGWASWDPQAGDHGRHQEYGRRVTDLVGIFSIEMEIRLGSNLSSSPVTACL